MDSLLPNPKALIALLCIIGLVIGVNAPLLLSVGQRKALARDAQLWGKALRGGADVRKQQSDQLSELHRRVEELKGQKPETDKDNHEQ
jgi:hypothetical protein